MIDCLLSVFSEDFLSNNNSEVIDRRSFCGKERQMIIEKCREMGLKITEDINGKCRCPSPFSSSALPLLVIDRERDTFFDMETGLKGDGEEFIRRISLISPPVFSLDPLPREKETEESLIYKGIMRDSWGFYRKRLEEKQGEKARGYLEERGFGYDGFGYSGDYGLYKYLMKKGYREKDIRALKLVREKDAKYHDVFMKRVMIPIRDAYGDIVAFGGRLLEESEEFPKYMNSSETPIFSKRDMLFGYDVARTAVCNSYILCEGYMDVLSLHREGFTNAVASLGTSLTKQQCMLMKNKHKVYVMYDSDEAGVKASIRAIPMLQSMGFIVRRIELGEYKDPDELLREKGKEGFLEKFEESIDGTEYMLEHLSGERAVDYLCSLILLLLKRIEKGDGGKEKPRKRRGVGKKKQVVNER